MVYSYGDGESAAVRGIFLSGAMFLWFEVRSTSQSDAGAITFMSSAASTVTTEEHMLHKLVHEELRARGGRPEREKLATSSSPGHAKKQKRVCEFHAPRGAG